MFLDDSMKKEHICDYKNEMKAFHNYSQTVGQEPLINPAELVLVGNDHGNLSV